MKNHQQGNFTSKLAALIVTVMAALFMTACGSSTPTSSPVSNSSNQGTSIETVSGSTATPADQTAASGQTNSSANVSFANDISPIFTASCVKCHGGERVNRGLDLTSYDSAMKGSVRGAVILPGDPDNSTLVQLVVNGKMPKQGAKLSQSQIDLIKAWISQGAPNN